MQRFRNFHVVCFALFCAAVLVVCAVAARGARAQGPREAVDVDNVTRSYVVHVPKYFDKTKKYPAVSIPLACTSLEYPMAA